MTSDEHVELEGKIAELRDRLDHVEALALHQVGIVIAIYNGLNQLGSLMLHVNQATAQSITHTLARREQPEDVMLQLKSEMDAFSASLSDIVHRLDLMNEHLS